MKKDKNLFIIIVVVVIIIITVGLFFYYTDKSEKLEDSEKSEKEIEKENLEFLFLQNKIRIQELEANIENIKRRERKIFKWVRIILGMVIILINLIYEQIRFHYWN